MASAKVMDPSNPSCQQRWTKLTTSIRTASWVLSTLLVLILPGTAISQSGGRSAEILQQEHFQFTQESYNATILENSVAKTFATPTVKMGMYVFDPTLDIRYRVTSGDSNKLFKAEERTVGDFCFLRLRTRSGMQRVINRERQDVITLTVKAIAKYKNGPTLIDTCQVVISVLDANDAFPLFYPTSYDLELPENTALHQSVLQVSASDADIGVNGEVYYSFKEKTETFAIHPTSGVITLTRPLSYIEQKKYELDIQAEDRGPQLGMGSSVATAKLSVKVKEVNFNNPRIDVQELPAVVEHGTVGTIYAILYVTDRDYGNNGQIRSVEITKGDPDGFFRLESGSRDTEYTIQVAKTLDREIHPEGFNLTVVAHDRGRPPKSVSKVVYVALSDTNDNAPRFEHQEYSIMVNESVPLFTPLTFVRAADTDLGQNSEIVYSINNGNSLGWFAVNPLTGLVTVAGPLDAERSSDTVLTITAQDRANTGARKTSAVSLHISILDCNDNAPVFNHTMDTVNVEESTAVGSEVFQVSAYDLDQGDNGYISYSIANIDDVPFSIDPFTGVIMSKQTLDYESQRRMYKLRVRASDWGSPYRRESETIVTIRIRDVNDNQPRFEGVNCTGYLSREAPRGTQLVVVSAIDYDVGNIISYEIISGNDDGCFEISSSSGSVSLNCDLKDHRGNFRSLTISATDGRNVADSTTVNITYVNNNHNRQLSNNNANINCKDTGVTREFSQMLQEAEEKNQETDEDRKTDSTVNQFLVNSHTPLFGAMTPLSVEIEEGMPVGAKIAKFTAKDEDSGYNGRLLYVITTGNDAGVFKIDTYTGELLVMSEVDRETRDHYTLNITAFDMGLPPRSTFTILDVVVMDVNDFSPKFEKSSYSVTISENTLLNTNIMQVTAHDEDLGANAEITYSILTDTSNFEIEPQSGVISISNILDREAQEVYNISVMARDGAHENPLSSIVTVTIKLDDINDNAPVFLPDTYHARVREDLPTGAVVMVITAFDPDLGGDGTVRYNLQDGMDGKFEIDRQTGAIRIVDKLDYEIRQIYNITARARDRGEPTLMSKCQVIIEVIDVDENMYPPMFPDFVFHTQVQENQPRNTTVLALGGFDEDRSNPKASPKDYEIAYSIHGGSGMGYFTIDRNGIVRTNAVLDRETTSRYWLTIYARDKGTVPRSSYVEVYVEIQDVNDNTPTTVEPVYYPSVPENSPEGTSVVRLVATDQDSSTNNQLRYEITSGNPQGFFAIDTSTGLISTTNRKLDREKQEEHILEVTISDSGVPSLSSTTRVVVSVSDVNDVSPKFTERFYRASIPAMPSESYDVPLFRVLASDDDLGPNADIDYSIKTGRGNGRFKINPKTGVITSRKDFEAGVQYDLTVKAVDNGRPQLKGTCRVLFTVVDRPLQSPTRPRFVDGGRRVTVMESDPIGHMVALVTAEDADGDKIWYSIIGGNDENRFSIGAENGNIVLAGRLDWETRTEYNLTIHASDGVNYVYTWILVTVLDINDNRPEFSQSQYEVSVAENTAPGTDVVTVTATDRDEDRRLFYTIHSSTDQISRAKFKINSETGVVTTIDTLNREAIGRHELTIMVRDQGAPSKRSLARVIITITDHNDHSPEFLSASFEGRVFETAAIGTSIVQVQAIDRDHDKNAEIKYSILSGNVGNVFSIDSTLGIVSVSKALERDTHADYDVVVRAVDGGTPSLAGSVHVFITVTVSDNAPPKFEMEEYATELEENKPEGSFVISVHASSRSSVVYDITGGDEGNLFTINPNSGVVSTNTVFDYEEYSFFNLTVRATNMVGVFRETTVMVHLIDENDNKPVFTKESYIGNISEASLAGSVVLDFNNAPLVVKAADADTNLNSLLIYEIVERNSRDQFSIDANTGAIRTRSNLDHEVAAQYQFTVQVTDMGTPRQSAEVPAKVTINIMDVNDSPPRFNHEIYTASLLLPTHEGVVVTTVKAVDNDSLSNSQLTYSIKSGNLAGHFRINPENGEIYIAKSEDLDNAYDMSVHVTDGKYENEAFVEITVEETDPDGLAFSQQIYYADIQENVTGVAQVAVMQAVGHALNEHLTFSILNPTDKFQVGTTSGVVQTNGEAFDREQRENYTLVMAVQDQRTPPRVAHSLLHIHVEDMNDNYPIFVNRPYYAIVSVDGVKGDLVKKVEAIDADSGDNGDLTYSIVQGGEGKFRINKKSGHVIVKKKLEREDQNKEYVLIIRAQDSGIEPKATQVQLPIKVMNKATPIFDETYYKVSVAENIPLHGAVATIEARSPTGGKLIYSISAGDIYGEFAVDFNTDMDVFGPCSVTAVEELDFELRKTYELTVRATDIQTGSYAQAIVNIKLEDVNDQAPSFESQRYIETISEAAPIGTSLLTVSASDKDSKENAKVSYRIQANSDGSDDSSFFHIDSERGIVLTKQKLDHESKTKLTFQVVATDHGYPALSSSVNVEVIVLDLNDNPPRFDHPSYDVTISDLVKRGQFVTIVTASDADSSDAHNLAYSIVGGNEKQAFSIEEYSGVISLSSLRKPDLQTSYTLNVSVTDGVFTAFTRVTVTVQNSNNHAPSFSHAAFDMDVAENSNTRQRVGVVQAADPDFGVYGEVIYDISSEDVKEFFMIDQFTGEIFTYKQLDREEKALYNVPVTATDGGGRTGYTLVRVNVADQGDNIPQFIMEDYKANVYSKAEVGSFVVQVSALDKDLGLNSDLEYSIVDGPDDFKPSQFFSIDLKTGIIRVEHDILGLQNQLIQFFVRCTDKGSPPSENDVPVEIYVMDPEDYPPHFEQPIYTYFIPEDRPAGAVIATVHAESNDTIVYSVVPGSLPYTNVPEKFGISTNGQISVVDDLDRESTRTFELTIKAETETSPPLVAHTKVTVQIMDINDNKPTFESKAYQVSIAENAEVGTKLTQVIAHDKDEGANADISYDFATEHSKLSNMFGIDPQSGWISTLVELDRETTANYTFNITATDRGTPAPLKDVTTIYVTVTDQNDEAPEFTENLYVAAVNEDALPGTVILSITTTDRDLPENARVTYHVTGGDEIGQFDIKSTGEIYVNKELDREVIPAYELVISATDGAFVSTATVRVSILDANDNPPICEQPIYEAIIPENIPVGSFVTRVGATDADEAGTPNARIDYSLVGPHSNMFVMHRKTGIISTKMVLDREENAEFVLTVTATDGGGLTCQAEVYVTLTDVNDNEPKFSKNQYTVSIPENAEINTLLTRVSASDEDLGINRKVRYAMKESDGHFTIDPVSGIVSLTRSLDREVQSVYNLTVYAHDQGTPKLTSRAYLLVRLIDINDNPPEFEHSVYSATVREDTSVGSSVMQVFATSRDTGINAEITYDIIAGNEQGKFRMDSKTGVLAVIDPLDYESAREYFLSILATDGGTPPLSNTAIVKVNITDANDNAPVFGMTVYHAEVLEDAKVGHNILQVEALDLDSVPNAGITFSIGTGDRDGHFTINSDDGYISVLSELDREKIAEYEIDVLAVDSGTPQMTGTVLVKMKVGDINDNPPFFTQHNYTAVVQVDDNGDVSRRRYDEDKTPGYTVLRFEVEDADEEVNGPPYKFDIVEGQPDHEFKVDDDGVLTTAARFNRDIKDQYDLVIRVYDNGSPSLFTDTTVTVKVIEESAFPPVVLPLHVNIAVYDDEFPGGMIGKVAAEDPDQYDHLTYTVISNEMLFDVHQWDGTIKAIQSLDAGDYKINVSVSDGKFRTFADVRLHVWSITDDMAENAVVVRFKDMPAEEFMDKYKRKLLKIMNEELQIPPNHVVVLSVQPASNTVDEPSRKKREAQSDLDVLLAVRKTQDTFRKGNPLRRQLTSIVPIIEKKMNVQVDQVFNDICEKDMCESGQCKTEIKFNQDQMFPVLTDSESFVSVGHKLSYRCKCRQGYAGPQCDEMVDACTPNPCASPQICRLQGQLGYRCECPAGKEGPDCSDDIQTACTEPRCFEGKPLTFSGQSYARWRLNEAMQRRFTLSLDVRTVQKSARLVHAVGRVDYSLLEMVKGAVQYRFDCGSGEGLVRVDSIRIDDGQWHKITVERRGRMATVTIDGKATAESSAPGTNDLLNLNSHDIYFGAEVETGGIGFEDVRKGFEGCMRSIKILGVTLPYSGSSEVGTLQKFEKVEFHCKRSYVPGICSSSPCFNGGICIPMGIDSYRCKCINNRFVGARCEVDTNPCESNPCRHNGICEKLANDFRCICKGKLEGKRCERGYYCNPNPCKNNGLCMDGETSPICTCSGFEGLYCERDINECLDSPCQNGGTCHNVPGSFKCECPPESSGDYCEVTNFTSIASSSFNITMEEIIGIGAVVLGLIIIVLIFLLIVRYRRRKRRRENERFENNRGSNDFIYNCDDYKRNQKMNNVDASNLAQQNISPNTLNQRNITQPSPKPSPRPPPVPTRPASYTPSYGDSVNTLNNFDTIHNYGSAADELENVGTLPHIEIPEFLTNLDVEKSPMRSLPPPPGSAASSENLQKKHWDPENHNIAGNYAEGRNKPHNKSLNGMDRGAPSSHPGAIAGPLPAGGSISSLPISESEDEMPGYHWDASDWAPNPTLPNITEVPIKEVPDSPASSRGSHDSNRPVNPDEYDEFTDYYPDEPAEYVDSEYVVDSECGEEDEMLGGLGGGGADTQDEDYPDPPNFEQILANMHEGLPYEENFDSMPRSNSAPRNYNLHPNKYLPTHAVADSAQGSRESFNNKEPEANGNGHNIARDDDDDVIHYGFPRPGKKPDFYSGYTSNIEPQELDYGTMSGIDNMSVSMGGYTSTNASMSDISGLCEIDDSEVNLSDNDSNDELEASAKLLAKYRKSTSHTHTQV